jgi:O-antigen/teichoic acid export membrane protein
MAEISSNNKRIAKNTVMLYIRMLLSTVVSLYTSRVVLQTLGVEDYGIYGVVGGVVAMFSFLNSTMAGATSRFLTFEMGKGDKKRLRDTFSSALIIHIGIALLVLILAETIGLWFLNNKLVIPEGRMGAAHWVFQFSVLGMFVGFTQVPYNATIIAHEKMDIYAYIELLHVFLKLGIVYLLVIGNFDKLILYALLTLVVNVIIAMIYRVYCIRHYEESKFKWNWDKEIMKPMFRYSGWEILGHFGFTFRTQGINMVLNMFFGAAINAAANLATTVQNVLMMFTNNVTIAVKPQIIKRYASGQLNEMSNLIYTSIKLNLFIVLIVSIPVICCMDYILTLWLKNVPEYCAVLCKIMLYSNIISAISHIVYAGIQATGDLKITSILRNILYISTPIVTYIIFKFTEVPPTLAYIVILASQVLLAITDILILNYKIETTNLKYIFSILIKISFSVMVILFANHYIKNLVNNQLLELVTILFTTIVILLIEFYIIVLNKREKELICKTIKDVYNKTVKK